MWCPKHATNLFRWQFFCRFCGGSIWKPTLIEPTMVLAAVHTIPATWSLYKTKTTDKKISAEMACLSAHQDTNSNVREFLLEWNTDIILCSCLRPRSTVLQFGHIARCLKSIYVSNISQLAFTYIRIRTAHRCILFLAASLPSLQYVSSPHGITPGI